MSRLFVSDQANRLAGDGSIYRHYARPYSAEHVAILLFSLARDAKADFQGTQSFLR